MPRSAVFLDRDGVLNASFVREGVSYPPQNARELEILPDVPEAMSLLSGAGFLLIGVTNQPDVARGTQSVAEIERINSYLKGQLPLQAIYTCYHDNADKCACRKPLPGLLLQAAADYDIVLAESYMVGDRWSDVVAGEAAGCTTFLINQSYSQSERCKPNYSVRDLLEAARIILKLREGPGEKSR